MRLTTVNAIYSRLAKTYDRELRDDMEYTAYLKVPQLVINALGHNQANILDLGCGTGLSSLLFFEKGYDVTGIDRGSCRIRRSSSRIWNRPGASKITRLTQS
jgi:predicted TPR repeat methyltransferase